MKIQIASDLHLEMLQAAPEDETLIVPAAEAELLILAGDICRGAAVVERFNDWPVPVVCVAGNHEFYSMHWEQTRADLKRASRGTQVHFLDNDCMIIDEIRVLGATLWTDFVVRGFTQRRAMEEVELRLNDYYRIATVDGILRAKQTLEDHRISRQWLSSELTKPFAGKTVVVTHHGPHPLSVHPRYAGQVLNAGFVSDLTELVQQADLWVHGHGHNSVDYRIGRCRVVSNPAGYADNRGWAELVKDFDLENKDFVPDLVIDV